MKASWKGRQDGGWGMGDGGWVGDGGWGIGDRRWSLGDRGWFSGTILVDHPLSPNPHPLSSAHGLGVQGVDALLPHRSVGKAEGVSGLGIGVQEGNAERNPRKGRAAVLKRFAGNVNIGSE